MTGDGAGATIVAFDGHNMLCGMGGFDDHYIVYVSICVLTPTTLTMVFVIWTWSYKKKTLEISFKTCRDETLTDFNWIDNRFY